MTAWRERIKWWLFPGLNLHARLRMKTLPRSFGESGAGEERWVLDAGCGNGMLTYQSYLKGNRVIGVSIKEQEVERCRKLFNGFLGIPEDRLSFRVLNLYEVGTLNRAFDEIICSEVIEHIRRDTEICRSLWNALKPGGVLHLCAPNADHPDNASAALDTQETGGHVRPGYTMDTYKALLEPLGFRIAGCTGIGGPVRQSFNRRIILLQEARHPWMAALLGVAALPFLWIDSADPKIPFSLYIRTVKESS